MSGIYGTYDPPPKFIEILDPRGGDPILLPVVVDASGNYIIGGLIPSGLGSTTVGVADSVNKRFVADTELARLQYLLANSSEQLLAPNTLVDMNAAAADTTLYTVPGGKTCVITKIVVRNASVSLTTASYSFGFNAGTCNDVVVDGTHTGLTGATMAIVINPIATGHKMGAAAAVFAVRVNTGQGAPATARIDVYGYTF
jgi:hypothetical protein